MHLDRCLIIKRIISYIDVLLLLETCGFVYVDLCFTGKRMVPYICLDFVQEKVWFSYILVDLAFANVWLRACMLIAYRKTSGFVYVR